MSEQAHTMQRYLKSIINAHWVRAGLIEEPQTSIEELTKIIKKHKQARRPE